MRRPPESDSSRSRRTFFSRCRAPPVQQLGRLLCGDGLEERCRQDATVAVAVAREVEHHLAVAGEQVQAAEQRPRARRPWPAPARRTRPSFARPAATRPRHRPACRADRSRSSARAPPTRSSRSWSSPRARARSACRPCARSRWRADPSRAARPPRFSTSGSSARQHHQPAAAPDLDLFRTLAVDRPGPRAGDLDAPRVEPQAGRLAGREGEADAARTRLLAVPLAGRRGSSRPPRRRATTRRLGSAIAAWIWPKPRSHDDGRSIFSSRQSCAALRPAPRSRTGRRAGACRGRCAASGSGRTAPASSRRSWCRSSRRPARRRRPRGRRTGSRSSTRPSRSTRRTRRRGRP